MRKSLPSWDLGISGRRESNPQPTAWKAVTLPLSYSRASFIWGFAPRPHTRSLAGAPRSPLRSRGSLTAFARVRQSAAKPTFHAPGDSRHLTARAPDFACRRAPPSRNSVACPHPRAGGSPSSRSSPRSGERRLMAREGFEPSKALGRQIYSLLRLTASLPRPNSRESAPKARFAALHETVDLSGFAPLCEFPSCVTRGAGEGI